MISVAIVLMSSLLASGLFANSEITWGISESELNEKLRVEQTANNGHGHGYSDFSEVNPVVYINETKDGIKHEFYFFKNKLYKTYTIYRDQSAVQKLYQARLQHYKKNVGEPSKVYEDQLFSLPIQHTVWENESEKLDVRLGAGFVYEVREYKPIAAEKQNHIDMQHAI